MCDEGSEDTFKQKRHERDLGRFHSFEGLSIGFVVERWILERDRRKSLVNEKAWR